MTKPQRDAATDQNMELDLLQLARGKTDVFPCLKDLPDHLPLIIDTALVADDEVWLLTPLFH